MEGKGKGYTTTIEGLKELFEELKKDYKVIAPTLKDGVILYKEVGSFENIAFGYRNTEAPGFYSLEKAEGYFTYTHPANSPKSLLHPPELTLIKVKASQKGLVFEEVYPEDKICLFDLRACDLWAIKILDRVFLEDPYYQRLRSNLFLVAVECTYATLTCFCKTMETGPVPKEGYDLLITELEGRFLIRAGSKKGEELLVSLKTKREAKKEDFEEREKKIRALEEAMESLFNIREVPQKLYSRMDSSYWEPVEKRCLACTSCTQVCPTCFCFDILEKNTIDLRESKRVRVWDSCFSPSFATVHRFNLRQSVHSRYRQWLMHKFAYWIEQFDTFGCVGCGRCITWCPVGIDIRQEVKRVAG